MKLAPIGEVHVDELLGKTVRAGCREMHLRAGQSPQTRSCHGAAGDFLPYDAFSPLDIQQIVYAILTDEQIWQFEREGELFLSYSVTGLPAFEVHITRSKSGVEADFVVTQI